MRAPVAAHAAAVLAALCICTASRAQGVCYVRADTVSVGAGENIESRSVQSHLGMRPKGTQLYELDISIAGQDAAVCSLSGVAKLRGDPGKESLALVVRPDPGRKSGRSGTLCQVFVQLTPTAVELSTTQSSCQAQSLCGGQVQLQGQRFEHTAKLPAASKGPCFEQRAP
jgi:hypothetical protein